MKKILFINTVIILCAGLLVFLTASVYVTKSNNMNIAKDMVVEMAQICAGLYRNGADIEALDKIQGETRITVIAPDGTILSDSRPLDVAVLENHMNRPEIQAAQRGTPQTFVRYSHTLGVDLIYYALKAQTDDGYVFIRTAIPAASIETYLLRSFPFLALLMLAIVLVCFYFTRESVYRIVEPFGSVEKRLRQLLIGEYKSEPVTGSYEEIEAITREIDGVAGLLQRGFDVLREEKSKLDYILGNIADGIFAVDESENIALINAAALDIFNVTGDITGKKLAYLSYNEALIGAVEDCVTLGKSVIFEASLNGRTYFANVKPLHDIKLCLVVLSDITESRENAKQREEFFANASHELKTPLTAIKGFNELTAINNKDESIKKYIESITRETERMLSLIADMLKLSELENSGGISPVPVPVIKTVNEVFDAMMPAINAKEIVYEVSGDGSVKAEPGHIYDLVKNLIENAVRYNNQGGNVRVTFESDNHSPRLIIADNGIGIPPEEQTRIFERFYRVEKSRSQRNGGTGLGLSIVKHICKLYGWGLLLKSKPGVGSEITVVFNGSRTNGQIF